MPEDIKDDVYLLLGTNIGDWIKNLSAAISAIEQRVGLVKRNSSVYKTAAWGKTDQPAFHNQVIEVGTLMSPRNLLSELKAIENGMGRKAAEKWGERIIDIDILLYGNRIVEMKDLVIPHPQIPNRKFTLVPLSELVPSLIHPKLGKSIATLLANCSDTLPVIRIDNPYPRASQ